jgi:prepilin-type N-terminal cleavage/methylation domain-containing protein
MRRGFSLVEVLIAVLVLALGLLGLGAVFPVILAEQRDAFDATNGEAAAQFVENMMQAGSEIVKLDELFTPEFGRVEGNLPGAQPGLINGAEGTPTSLWIVAGPAALDGDPGFVGAIPGTSPADFANGAWSSNTRGNIERDEVLPVAARLFPQLDSGLDPRFVWDLVARRSPVSSRVEMAVFVRRIDGRIRVPRGFTLSDVLTRDRGVPVPEPILPLAIDAEDGRVITDDGNNGNAVYPVPQSLSASVYQDQLSWLVFEVDPTDEGLDTTLGFVRQVGQKLLDNTGVVRTVVGLPQPVNGQPLASFADRAVVVDPPFKRANASNGRTVGNGASDSARYSWVQQIVFTPQIPVAVRVFSLEQK